MTIRYEVRDREEQGVNYLMWGNDDFAAACTTMRRAIEDGYGHELELVAIDLDGLIAAAARMDDVDEAALSLQQPLRIMDGGLADMHLDRDEWPTMPVADRVTALVVWLRDEEVL